MLTDENAFGLLASYHDLENAEYALEQALFSERFRDFRSRALTYASSTPLSTSTRILDFGHAVYFEFADGEQLKNPIEWLKGLAATLKECDCQLAAILSHGGRWLEVPAQNPLGPEELEGNYQLISVALPSEPLRRALYAETATHGLEGEDGWGPGLYVDTEALEALGKSPKNAPTALSVAGATFYRVGR